MGLFTGIFVFLLIWWTALFAVLPFGLKAQGVHLTGAGAPENPKIKQKFLMTTLVSVIIWLIIYALIAADIIDFHDLAKTMHEKDVRP